MKIMIAILAMLLVLFMGTAAMAAEGKFFLTGEKALIGRAMTENDVFTFEFTDENGRTTEVTNKGEDIVFGEVEYTINDRNALGVHTYTVKETSDDTDDITVDKNKYTITVTVELDKADCTLHASADLIGTKLTFNNFAEPEVKISKVDMGTGGKVEGAHIQIIDSEGKVVKEWDSTKEAHVVKGLKTGEEYTLRETVAPDGYTITTDTTFSIDKTGKVTSTGSVSEDGVLLVEDERTHIEVSKVDVTGGYKLSGAHIQIIDSIGKVAEEWDSTDEAHVIEGLKAGEEYTLHETVAPEGYTVATDTTFTIDKTGKVTTTGSVTEDGVLLVKDERTHIEVSKVDGNGDKLSGATMQILDSEGRVVDEGVTSDKGTHAVNGLKTGVTYKLHESVTPEGYATADDKTFTIDEKGRITSDATLDTDDAGNTVIIFENTEITYTTLTVYKKWTGVGETKAKALPDITLEVYRLNGDGTASLVMTLS